MKQTDPTGILESRFTYDRFDHLTHEKTIETNNFAYDCIGNCLRKNNREHAINPLNQLINNEESTYTYDLNGNLKSQSFPQETYHYDALDRLIRIEKEGDTITFLYDAFDRCLFIIDKNGTRQLLYQGKQEIGSMINGQLQELRIVHPEPNKDLTFAIELKNEVYFPIQDYRGNICALQRKDGSLAEWVRYSAFGKKLIAGNFADISQSLEICQPKGNR